MTISKKKPKKWKMSLKDRKLFSRLLGLKVGDKVKILTEDMGCSQGIGIIRSIELLRGSILYDVGFSPQQWKKCYRGEPYRRNFILPFHKEELELVE